MRTLTLACLALCAVGARAETKTIPLTNLTPSALAGMLADEKTLLLPDGIDAMTLEVRKKSVTFSGTHDGLAQVALLIRMLDKPARRVTLSLRLVRDGKVVATPTVLAVNNKKSILQSPGLYNLELLPHVFGDGAVSVQVETATEKAVRRLTPGKAESIPFKYTTVWITATVPDLPKPK